VRRRRRRAVVEIAVATHERATAPDPSTAVGDIDLARALAGLRPEDRALLALRYVAGLNSFELGRAMGMSASGLRRRLARLLALLRTELSDA
jgi:RNA polymerase sigma factor (sigma-70 family)